MSGYVKDENTTWKTWSKYWSEPIEEKMKTTKNGVWGILNDFVDH